MVTPERTRKSVGCESTFENDLTNYIAVIIELYHVTTELILRLEKSDFKGHTLTLKIKLPKRHVVSLWHTSYEQNRIFFP